MDADGFRARLVRDASGCLLWTGAKHRSGYGVVRYDGRVQRAHRVAYALAYGPIAPGLDVDHACHAEPCSGGFSCPHRLCCEPTHLQAISHVDNVRRGMSESTQLARTGLCKRGHSLDDAVTIVGADGHVRRRCRTCKNNRRRGSSAAARDRSDNNGNA